MSNRVLVTGSEGFTGRYVCDEFSRAGWEVWGAGLQPKPNEPRYLQIDLLRPETLSPLITKAKPDVVIHLAAIAFVAENDPAIFYRVNLMGTRHLLEVLAGCDAPPDCTILASSANVYGNSNLKVLSEDSPLNPSNEYAVSKLAMEHMARTFMNRLGITITRPFNYTGVGQDINFLIPKIVAHFASNAHEIELGNLDVERDFTDVRDVARIYLELAKKRSIGETFNICSGKAISLEEIIKQAESVTGRVIDVKVNANYVRENEVKSLVGNPQKLTALTSSQPLGDIRRTIRWMIETAQK